MTEKRMKSLFGHSSENPGRYNPCLDAPFPSIAVIIRFIPEIFFESIVQSFPLHDFPPLRKKSCYEYRERSLPIERLEMQHKD
jgi:hypothetical protein